MHAIAHGDCTDTVSGSALEADSGEKFLAAWEFELRWYYAVPGFSVGRYTN